jgi:hypothetical protein
MEYSKNFSRTFFVADAPSQIQRQVSCWPHTSFGSKGKKEEVSESLFVDLTNKFKALNFSNFLTVYNGTTTKNELS